MMFENCSSLMSESESECERLKQFLIVVLVKIAYAQSSADLGASNCLLTSHRRY